MTLLDEPLASSYRSLHEEWLLRREQMFVQYYGARGPIVRTVGADAARVALRTDAGVEVHGEHMRRSGMHTVQMHNTSVQYCGQETAGVFKWLKRFNDARALDSHKGWDLFAELESQVDPLRTMGAQGYCLDGWRLDEAAITTVQKHFNAVDRLQCFITGLNTARIHRPFICTINLRLLLLESREE